MPTPNRSGTGPRPAVAARRKTGRNPVATRNADGVAPQTDPWRVGRRVAWTALAAILPVCALIAWRTMSGMPVPHAADQPPPWMAPGMAMTDRLAAIQEATKASPLGNRFANIEKADYLLGIDPPADIAGRQDYELKLAFNLLYAGRTQEAIRRFETIETGLAASQRPARLLQEDVRMLLGMAWLRLGEQTNCIQRHTADACLLPIRGAGVHTDQYGSQKAIDLYAKVLEANPANLTARWMLNIAAMTLGRYPDAVPAEQLIAEDRFAAEQDIGRFPDVAADRGLDLFSNAGGAVMDDFDGDQDLDVVFSSQALTGQLRYFQNDGSGRFTDRTEAAGLLGQVGGLQVDQTDYNNDGRLDLFVPRGAWLGEEGRHPDSLLRNNGDGTFTDVTEAAGLLSFHPGQVGAWGDYDGDGWLDLFVGNEMVNPDQAIPSAFGQDGATTFPPHPSELYRNRGDGTFAAVAVEVQLKVEGFVKGAAWGDYDNDGRIDLYVSRDGEPNLLFHNDGPRDGAGWSFSEVSAAAGVSQPLFSFSTWFWDYDHDGWEDIFVADYGQPQMGRTSEYVAGLLDLPTEGDHPYLYRNNGDGSFTEVGAELGLDRPTFTMGSNFGDLDNDGWLDAYLATGDPQFESLIPNRMYRNDQGRRFREVTASGGFGHLQKGHGVAFGDIDGDGDQDLLANQGGAYAGDGYYKALFLNPGHGNRWVTLVLEGSTANRAAIGARLKLTLATAEGPRILHATVGSGSSFGGNSLRQEIGLGQAQRLELVEITWPGSGRVQAFDGLEMDSSYRLREGEASAELLSAR
ncbi:MAG: CRTAC1 family protein [Ardenticatenia bacterium]|nr:CRTAC1 family protein [Ardenticatenia bacterium]